MRDRHCRLLKLFKEVLLHWQLRFRDSICSLRTITLSRKLYHLQGQINRTVLKEHHERRCCSLSIINVFSRRSENFGFRTRCQESWLNAYFDSSHIQVDLIVQPNNSLATTAKLHFELKVTMLALSIKFAVRILHFLPDMPAIKCI